MAAAGWLRWKLSENRPGEGYDSSLRTRGRALRISSAPCRMAIRRTEGSAWGWAARSGSAVNFQLNPKSAWARAWSSHGGRGEVVAATVIPVDDVSPVGEIRRAALDLARAEGLDESLSGNVALVSTEISTNLLKHARGGGAVLYPPLDRIAVG